jgi:hypothetical protein
MDAQRVRAKVYSLILRQWFLAKRKIIATKK